jgi:hypothetical protein
MQKVTTNHDEIRQWSERVGARPAVIDHADAGGDKVGLRLDFPGRDDEAELPDGVEKGTISWEDFFERFEEQQLEFIFEEEPNEEDKTQWYRFGKRTVNHDLLEAEKTRQFAQEMAIRND